MTPEEIGHNRKVKIRFSAWTGRSGEAEGLLVYDKGPNLNGGNVYYWYVLTDDERYDGSRCTISRDSQYAYSWYVDSEVILTPLDCMYIRKNIRKHKMA